MKSNSKTILQQSEFKSASKAMLQQNLNSIKKSPQSHTDSVSKASQQPEPNQISKTLRQNEPKPASKISRQSESEAVSKVGKLSQPSHNSKTEQVAPDNSSKIKQHEELKSTRKALQQVEPAPNVTRQPANYSTSKGRQQEHNDSISKDFQQPELNQVSKPLLQSEPKQTSKIPQQSEFEPISKSRKRTQPARDLKIVHVEPGYDSKALLPVEHKTAPKAVQQVEPAPNVIRQSVNYSNSKVRQLEEPIPASDASKVRESNTVSKALHVVDSSSSKSSQQNKLGPASKTLKLWFDANNTQFILKKLQLRGKDLRELPHEIFSQTNLEILDLSPDRQSCLDFYISSVPDDIGRLTNLRCLMLDTNHLTTLPETIRFLTTLEQLSLSNNCLQNLPNGLTALRNLKSFHCSNNELKQFPVQLCQLPDLEFIDLASNLIENVPAKIEALQKLTVLILCLNRITFLPESICTLWQLRCFWIGENCIEELPRTFGQLTDIDWGKGHTHSLAFEGNPLKHPPIDVCYNGIQAIANYFADEIKKEQEAKSLPVEPVKIARGREMKQSNRDDAVKKVASLNQFDRLQINSVNTSMSTDSYDTPSSDSISTSSRLRDQRTYRPTNKAKMTEIRA